MLLSGDDADDQGHCAGAACGGLYAETLSQFIADSTGGGDGILAVGVHGNLALASLSAWNDPANGGPNAQVTIVTGAAIAAVNFSLYDLLYVPSHEKHTSGGITDADLTFLNARKADIASFVNVEGGALVALTEAGSKLGYGWLPAPLVACRVSSKKVDPTLALAATVPGATATQANMSHCCYHNVWRGPTGLFTLAELATDLDVQGPAIVGGGAGTVFAAENCANAIDDDGDGDADAADPDCHDHFLCYKGKVGVKAEGVVSLVDQFSGGVFEFKGLRELCTPVAKNGGGVNDPATHLTSYLIKGPKLDPPQQVTIVSQFGEEVVEVGKPQRLLVPANKDFSPPVPPVPTAHDVDHYKCYKVKRVKTDPKRKPCREVLVNVEDQFIAGQVGDAKVLKVKGVNKKPQYVCTPVDKNGEGIKKPTIHLVCYKAGPAKKEPKHEAVSVFVANQLEPTQVLAKKEGFFCLPALKSLGPP